MKGVINAVGTVDSLGKDRLGEVRGLVYFGGKPVVLHTLEKFDEIGIDKSVVLVNPEHQKAYQDELGKISPDVEVLAYERPQDPLSVYFNGLRILQGDHILTVADDNIFDFSLSGLLKRFKEVDDNVLAVRDMEKIVSGQEDLNLGECEVDNSGKVIKAGHSFDPSTKSISGKVILDIYLVHEKRVPFFVNFLGNEHPTVEDAVSQWYKDFHAWEPEGFWADIGKPPLRKLAEEHFSK